MNLAPPIPRLERPRRERWAGARRRPGDRQPDAGQEPRRGAPARAPPGRLRDPRRRRRADRDRDPDGLLVVGAQGLPVAGRRHVRDRRAADPVGDPRARRDGAHDARRLPLPAARLGAVLSSSRSSCSSSSSCRSSTSWSAGRRAGSSCGPLPAIHPAEIAKLALVDLPRPLVRQARRPASTASGRAPSRSCSSSRRSSRSCSRSPTSARRWSSRLTAFTMFFVAGANLLHLVVMGGGRRLALITVGLQRLPARPHPGLAEPLARPPRRGLPHGPGPPRAGPRRPLRDGPRGEPGVRPERLQRLHLRRGRPGVRDDRGDRGHHPVPAARLLGRPDRAGRARHVRGAAGGRHHRLAVPPGVHQHRGRGRPAADHRDHAAVHQRRRLIAHHQLRGGRDPPVDLARNGGEGDVERRCDC